MDFIQLREKDLSGRELEALAYRAVELVRAGSTQTRTLINSRVDIALAVGADGVHLRSNDITPDKVRKIWQAVEGKAAPIVSVSCHTENDVAGATKSGADFVVFGPMFEKDSATINGLEALRQVSRYGIPTLALGGVNIDNAATCLEAGAAGITGIRLFQQGDIAATVATLRSLSK